MFTKKTSFSILLISIMVITSILAGCSGNADQTTSDQQGKTAAKRTVKHELGTLTFTTPPKRIVVLDTYLLDIATALGIQPVGVAQEELNNQSLPGYLKSRVTHSFTWVGSRKEPSLEMIASLKPDLIVADLQRHKEAYPQLSKIAPTMVVKGSGGQDWKQIVKSLALALNMPERGDQVIKQYEQKVAQTKTSLSKAGTIKVLPITIYPKQKVRIYTADSFTGTVLQDMGLTVPFRAGGQPFIETGVEKLADIKADQYLLLQSAVYTKGVDWKNTPVFKDLPAVKAGKVVPVQMETWSFYRGPLAAQVIADEAIKLLANKQAK
ncbi:iron-siderophore ABC transporter substrate-binding protein [Polycladomyces sp. WAk]|uniref:Iron-siderophore ABC transporter substrate-binding protein n=1 Tax=Polycladomyces zharkentensis TaxID=2807616 RepID=A0ABS2WLZ7_9BACL|nr:iron-siderophore ABC transporter substrate-binding protein [Polycladomyces sp. WAk]MBN2910549.1 iron-siderophore ABC transporter substrate-binding protein [Polycladomyces sp. WAk]